MQAANVGPCGMAIVNDWSNSHTGLTGLCAEGFFMCDLCGFKQNRTCVILQQNDAVYECCRCIKWWCAACCREDSSLCHVSSMLVSEFEADLTAISSCSDENDLSKLREYVTAGRGKVILMLLNIIGITVCVHRLWQRFAVLYFTLLHC